MRRTALVTGGTRGLGKAISLSPQSAAHQVAVVYHRNTAAGFITGATFDVNGGQYMD